MRQIGILIALRLLSPLQDLMVNLRERLRAVWRELDGSDPKDTCLQTGYLSCMDGLTSQLEA